MTSSASRAVTYSSVCSVPRCAETAFASFASSKSLSLKPIVKGFRTRRLLLHQCDGRRRVHATREKRAERHVGEHLLADRIADQVLQLFDGVLGSARKTARGAIHG